MNVFSLQDRRNKASSGARSLNLLPGVPEALIRRCFNRRYRNTLDSGQLVNLDYSSELVANAFGWFLERPHLFPTLPGLENYFFGAERIDLMRSMPFPWLGGRHPNFDVIVETNMCLIGIVSKRDKPFLAHKKPQFSAAFDRDVWGNQMRPFLDLRDQLRSGSLKYRYLDAAQLVKQALALSNECTRSGKLPILYYIFDEPMAIDGRHVSIQDRLDHRLEVYDFMDRVDGGQVAFFSASYFDWLSEWAFGDATVERHGENLLLYLALTGLKTSQGWGAGIHKTFR